MTEPQQKPDEEINPDAQMIRFLEVFATTLDAEVSAKLVGVEQSWAETRFLKSTRYRDKLTAIFDRQTKLFEYVPVAVLRKELITIVRDDDLAASARVQATKILTDMLIGVGGESHKMLGDLLQAVKNASEDGDVE